MPRLRREHAKSAVGRLILQAIQRHRLHRPTVAADAGLSRQLLWEIIWDRRPCPIDRLDALALALRLTEEETNALKLATLTDKTRRAGRWATPPRPQPDAPRHSSDDAAALALLTLSIFPIP